MSVFQLAVDTLIGLGVATEDAIKFVTANMGGSGISSLSNMGSITGGVLGLSNSLDDFINKGFQLGEDIQQNTAQVVDDTQSNLLYSGRYLSRNVVALLDNTQDNIFDTINNARVDVSNSLQLLFLMFGAGFIGFLIIFGDRLMKSGVKIGGISFL